MGITKASRSTWSLCTADTTGGCLTKLRTLVRLSRVTRLSEFVKGSWSSLLGTEFDNDVGASIASECGFTLPRSTSSVCIVAAVSTTPSRGALLNVRMLNIDLDATSDKWAEGRVFRAYNVIAIDGTQVVPEVILAGLKMVLNLDDTSRGNLIPRQVAELERNPAINSLAIDHTVRNDRVGRNGHHLVILTGVVRINGTNGPGVEIVGAVVDKLDSVCRRDETRKKCGCEAGNRRE